MKRSFVLLVLVALFFSCASFSEKFVPDGTRFIADAKPITVERVVGSIDQLFSRDLIAADIDIVFHPRTNKASLDFKYQTNKNKLYLSERARGELISEIQAYIADFDARKLNVSLKRTKTRRAYGSEPAELEWGLLTLNGYARPDLYFGYEFADPRSPYFVLFIPKSDNANGQNNEDKGDDYSVETTLFFTKSQAQALAEALRQENLLAAIDPKLMRKEEAAADEYGTK